VDVIFTVGSGVGPYLMGISFDATHSYATALALFCAMLIASSAIISRMGAYRFPAEVKSVAA
jgi:cyanate permease